MPKPNATTIEAVLEQLMTDGPQAMAEIFATMMNIAMRTEREQFLGADHYQRAAGRQGYANGFKPKTIDTKAGTLTLEIPKTAGTPEPFYPQSLERGRRSCRAVMLAAAEMLGLPRRRPGSSGSPPGMSKKSWPSSACMAFLRLKSHARRSCSTTISMPGAGGRSDRSVISSWMPVTRRPASKASQTMSRC